jgi:hypothetical protein
MKNRPHLDQKRHMKKPSGPRLDIGSARTRPHGREQDHTETGGAFASITWTSVRTARAGLCRHCREHHDGAVGDLIRAAAHR